MLGLTSPLDISNVLEFGWCDMARVGVAPFMIRDGEDMGPIDLRGEEPMFVLIGDLDRGGRRVLPLRTRPTTSVGSGIVPRMKVAVRIRLSGK